ncbi:MAG: dihydrofolate reductase, partial [Spirosomataceae bacterium]
MKISLILAVNLKGVIGSQNSLIWHLPNDLKRFKNLTMG